MKNSRVKQKQQVGTGGVSVLRFAAGWEKSHSISSYWEQVSQQGITSFCKVTIKPLKE